MGRVLVVGAGPAGASLAYLLAARGVEVTLLERQHDFAREFRGEVLMPSGIRAFEQMGLRDALGGVPHHSVRAGALYLGGRLVGEGKLAELGPAFAEGEIRAVSQPALLEMLVAEGSRLGSFEFRRGASVGDLLRDGGRVVGVTTRTDGRDEELRADLVVGADGRGSAVRRHGGFVAARTDQPMDIVWCKLPLPESWPGVQAYLDRGHLLIAYHTWDDTLQLGWVILKGTFGELRSRGVEGWVREMAAHVSPDFAAHLREHADHVERPFLLSVVSDCVASWSVPGALVIGDAAHTMSPVGGQGINIALRDALVATNHLAPVLADGSPPAADVDAALARIETERMREVAPLQRMQNLPPKVVLARAWWGEPLRRLAAALVASGLLRSVATRQAGAFTNGLTDVTLH